MDEPFVRTKASKRLTVFFPENDFDMLSITNLTERSSDGKNHKTLYLNNNKVRIDQDKTEQIKVVYPGTEVCVRSGNFKVCPIPRYSKLENEELIASTEKLKQEYDANEEDIEIQSEELENLLVQIVERKQEVHELKKQVLHYHDVLHEKIDELNAVKTETKKLKDETSQLKCTNNELQRTKAELNKEVQKVNNILATSRYEETKSALLIAKDKSTLKQLEEKSEKAKLRLVNLKEEIKTLENLVIVDSAKDKSTLEQLEEKIEKAQLRLVNLKEEITTLENLVIVDSESPDNLGIKLDSQGCIVIEDDNENTDPKIMTPTYSSLSCSSLIRKVALFIAMVSFFYQLSDPIVVEDHSPVPLLPGSINNATIVELPVEKSYEDSWFVEEEQVVNDVEVANGFDYGSEIDSGSEIELKRVMDMQIDWLEWLWNIFEDWSSYLVRVLSV